MKSVWKVLSRVSACYPVLRHRLICTRARSIISFSTQFAGITFVQCLSMSIDYKSGQWRDNYELLFFFYLLDKQPVGTKRYVRGTSYFSCFFLLFFRDERKMFAFKFTTLVKNISWHKELLYYTFLVFCAKVFLR